MRRAALVEVAVGFALVEAALWTEGAIQSVLIGAAAAWVAGATLRRRPSLEAVGLGGTGLAASAWVIAAAAVLALPILAFGGLAGTLQAGPWTARGLGYFPWALAQQLVAQSFFFVRLEVLLGKRGRAVWLTAALFGAAHLPNPVLVPATFAVTLLFTHVYARHRNLYPLAVAHVLLALAVSAAAPRAAHHGMRVGLSYLRYGP